MGWPIGLANDGLAQTWYELYDLVEHGKDPDPTPVSLAHLFYTHAHDPLSLVTSMSLRRCRSPPAAPEQPRHHRDGVFLTSTSSISRHVRFASPGLGRPPTTPGTLAVALRFDHL
jgi:hypothetical protein